MEISHALHAMWDDAVILLVDEGWVIRIAAIIFFLLSMVASVLVIRFRSRRALVALGIWSLYFVWWFLQYAIDSWTNPGAAGSFFLMVFAIIIGWALLASEIHNQRKHPAATSAAVPIAT